MSRPAHTTFGQGQTLSPGHAQARRKHLEAIRDAEHAAQIARFHREQRDRIRQQDPWRLPDPPEAA